MSETAAAPPPAEPVAQQAPPAVSDQPVTVVAAAEPAAPAEAAGTAESPSPEIKSPEDKPPLDPEAAAKRKAERLEKRKEARKAARQAAKEARAAAKAAGETPKPRAPRQPAKAGEVQAPEGAAPKVSVAKIPENMTNGELKELFEPHGTILRCEVTKRRGRPSRGTIIFNTHNDVRRAMAALNGKHTCPGLDGPVSIQYANDSQSLGSLLKTTTDKVLECLKQYSFKADVFRSKDAKDFMNRIVFGRSRLPDTAVLSAALLVQTRSATVSEVVASGMVKDGDAVQQLLRDTPASEKAPPRNAARDVKDEKPVVKLEKTFDAVVSRLDRLEKERWNRMAKANLRLDEYHRFRFVDILATPSLELWRWMVEDCEITPAEAGTCFYILSTYYGYAK